MNLKELRKFSGSVRTILFALTMLCVGLIVAMAVWCALFQKYTINVAQLVVLELVTVAALAIVVYIMDFFRDVNCEVNARIKTETKKWRHAVAKKTKTAVANVTETAQAIMNPVSEPTVTPSHDLWVMVD